MPDDSVSIKTFLRIKPTQENTKHIKIDDLEENVIHIQAESKEDLEEDEDFKSSDVIPFSHSSFVSKHFTYSRILNQNATQELVFDVVGKEAVENVLEGFNSTLFAYGQTGFDIKLQIKLRVN